MAERVEVLDLNLEELREEAQKSGKTLADLRKEVKDLKKNLEGTTLESDEFTKALKDLTVKQQELTNVTKSGNKAMEGSYNKLVNEMALLKQQWRSTGDSVERARLGEQIDKINTELKELDSSIGNNQRNVGNYKLALKNLKTELYGLEEGTDEYNQKLQEASELYIKMKDVNEFVANSAADSGEIMTNVVGVASAMAGAFQTVQASLQLFGIESDSVTESIKKMQAIMGLTSGLTAVEGGIDTYKRLNSVIKQSALYTKLFGNAAATATVKQQGLNAAMKANPLGIILTVLTAAITAYSLFGDKLKKAEVNQKSFNDAAKKSIDIHSDMMRVLDNETKVRKALGESEKQAIERRLNILKYGAATAKLKKDYDEASGAVAKFAVEEVLGVKHTDTQKEINEQNKEAAESLKNQIKTINNEIESLEADLKVININDSKAAEEDANKVVTVLKEADDTIIQNHSDAMKEYEEDTKKAVEAIRIASQKATEESIRLTEEAEAKKQYILETTNSYVDLEYSNMIELTNNLYKEQIKTAEKSGDFVKANQIREQSIDSEISLIEEQIKAYREYGLECTELILKLNDLREARKLATETTAKSVENEKLEKSKKLMDANIDSINALSIALQGLVMSSEGLFDNDELDALNTGLMGLANSFDIIKQGMEEVNNSTDKSAAKWKNYGAAASAGLSTASAVFSAFSLNQKKKIEEMGDGEAEAKKEAFEVQKKYSIAAAVTSTLSGIAAAWASCMQLGPIAGPIAGAALSAMMTGLGYAQVKQIKNTKFEDAYPSNGASSGSATPSMSALDKLGANPVQTTNNIEGASQEGKVKDTKIYVTETDISSTQDNVKATVDEASF